MNYWDIDSFLAEEQKLPCYFTQKAVGMQALDPSKGNHGNIDANEEIEMPIWVIRIINDYLPQMEEKDYLKIKFPAYLHSKQFQNRVNSFTNDDNRSSIQKLNFFHESLYMYESFLLLTKIMEQQKIPFEGKHMKTYLRLRGKCILIRASNYLQNKTNDFFVDNYTTFQKKIYYIAKRVMHQYEAWEHLHSWKDKNNSLSKLSKK